MRTAVEQREFVAGREPRAGRVTAHISPVLKDDAGAPLGLLGWFACPDDHAIAGELFAQSIAWLRSRGVKRVVGPMNGSTWHRYRVNVGPFDRPQFPYEPWNPPYWRDLWEQAGFITAESYSSKLVTDLPAVLPSYMKGAERSAAAGVRIRPLDVGRVRDELEIVHTISTQIFAEAPFYSPITLADFLASYEGVERLLDPELVVFACDSGGREIGFLFAYTAHDAVHFKTLGVLGSWRRSGVGAALAHHGYGTAIRRGIREANHALMRDDNASQGLDAGLGVVFRRYLLYEWPSTHAH